MTLFKLENFKAHSGAMLSWKIDCDALTNDDWKCLAFMASEQIGNFGSVEGVPTGGIPFANALIPYITTGPLLIVDDVLTTGSSMEEHRASREAIGIVVFSRNEPPGWIKSIFRME